LEGGGGSEKGVKKGVKRGKKNSVAHLGVPHCRKYLIVCGLGAHLTKFQICHFKAKSTCLLTRLLVKNHAIFGPDYPKIEVYLFENFFQNFSWNLQITEVKHIISLQAEQLFAQLDIADRLSGTHACILPVG